MNLRKMLNITSVELLLYVVNLFLQYLLFNVLIIVFAISLAFLLIAYINIGPTESISDILKVFFLYAFEIGENDSNIDMLPRIAIFMNKLALISIGISMIWSLIRKKKSDEKQFFLGIGSYFKRLVILTLIPVILLVLSFLSPSAQKVDPIQGFFVILIFLIIQFLFLGVAAIIQFNMRVLREGRLQSVEISAEPTGLEPATSSVTGKRSNQIELRLLSGLDYFTK